MVTLVAEISIEHVLRFVTYSFLAVTYLIPEKNKLEISVYRHDIVFFWEINSL